MTIVIGSQSGNSMDSGLDIARLQEIADFAAKHLPKKHTLVQLSPVHAGFNEPLSADSIVATQTRL